jgi:hypothetical protein
MLESKINFHITKVYFEFQLSKMSIEEITKLAKAFITSKK